MYLKKLDILGFKSFANKTTINFSNGITAIVGPNGCGKTNILDALRWVLGEQKVTLLRGSKMEEVIFNGSRDMKPLGMAEVTLTLVNETGILPTEYGELQITRRLFRSGESEYLFNKVPCRLKDITELFFDTGLGAHSYSVIQQDMVDSVISDRAEERRFLFEEAAGITKYKQRKRAALRKLDATETDFLRLNDIYSEVKTQVNSLKRQYKKAERYQKALDEIKAWELHLSSQRIKAVDAERREVKARADGLNDKMLNRQAELDKVSAELENNRTEQLDLEHELTGVGNQVYEISEKAHQLENEISVLGEKRSNAGALIERNRADIRALQARSEILSEQRAHAEEELSEKNALLESLVSSLAGAETTQAEADRQLLAARTTRESGNKKLVELEGRISSGKTEEDNLRQQEQELRQRLDEISSQIESSHSQLVEVQQQFEQRRQSLDDVNSRKLETETSAAGLREELERLVETGEDLAMKIADLTASAEACLARKHLLEEMMLHYEGHDSGVVAAMEVKDRWSGIAGTVAEKFVPTEGLEVAVEAALGELARYVICEERKTAENIIQYLKQERKGRIGILVPDSGTLNPVVKRPDISNPEFVGWLDTLVSTDEKLRPLMQAVLARVAVFSKGTDPTGILERLPYGFKAVSTDGTVYSKNIISGGSDDQFPLFRRREKVAEQERLIAELREQIDNLQTAKNQNTARIAGTRARSAHLASELDSLAEEVRETQEKLTESGYRRQTVENEIARLGRERQSAESKLDKIRHRQYSLELDYGQLASEKDSLVSNMSRAGTQLSDRETAAAEALEKVSRMQVQVVEARSKAEQIESKITHMRELQQELANTLQAKEQEIMQAERDIEASAGRIAELEERLKESFGRRSEMTVRQGQLREAQAVLLQGYAEKEKQVKAVRSDKEDTKEKLHQLEIRLTTLDSETRSIAERIRQEYEVDITVVETVNPDESLSRDQALEQLQTLREQLKKYGAVNLLALEEYHTTSDREKFLGEQLRDLETAKKDLQETIGTINNTARKLFHETFSRVRENFQQLFTELFTGGEADISLENPDDPLESEIVIIARPRGKKLLSITMMSGGERALTAIALLFSLYMVKPSPFCILDEIDAPLDDANCRRFLKIIGVFSAQTQFIAITHNKITMEVADNLYGVTMEQPGISKLVAVKFSEIADDDQRLVTAIAEFRPVRESRVSPPADLAASDEVEGPEEGNGEPEIPQSIVERMTPKIVHARDEEEPR